MGKGIYIHKKGRKLTEEHKRKIGEANAISKLGKKLKPHSKEWNEKIRKSLMGHSAAVGDKSVKWKGDHAGYYAFHKRIQQLKGKPCLCEICGEKDRTKRYEWANLTGKYMDMMDYKRMCKSCHTKYDYQRRESGKATI